MEEIQYGFRLPAPAQKNLGQWQNSWQLGQVFRAQVIDKSSSGQLLLRIAGHQVTASTDIQVNKGAVLRLEVSGLHPVPSMKILDAGVQGVLLVNPLDRQLQQLLSRHGSVLAPFVALQDPAKRVNLLSLLGVKNGVVDRDYDYLSQVALPRDPKALQKALLQSGFFLESELLQLANAGGGFSQVDMKAMLFRLLRRINHARGQSPMAAGDKSGQVMLSKIQAELEGALATLTLNQLSACQRDERDASIWLFDMPFRIRDALHGLSVSIKREESASLEEPDLAEWKVLISLSLPVLGEIEAELFLRGRRVSVVFYAQEDRGVQILEKRLPELGPAMARHGLELSIVRCQQGSCSAADRGEFWRKCVDEKI